MTALRRMLTGMTLAVLASGMASASIIYNFVSVTPSGPNFDWKYTAQLSADQRLSSTATDFAVVYDFLGVLSASTSSPAAGLTVTTFLEAITSPQPAFQSIPDSAAFMNVHSTITGTLTPAAQTAIYTIDIIATSGVRGTFAFQSGQALKNVPGDPSDGTLSGNSVMIEAPTAAGVPEPITMTLMGSALLALGVLRRRRVAK